MSDTEMQDVMTGEREIAARLEAFAAARLSPPPAAVRRMRSRVMREARARLEVAAAPLAVEEIPVIGARSRTFARRGVGLLLAAGLSVTVVAGGVLAAGPGGPLYGAAMWLEEATLPAAAGPRTEAEIRRLDRRLEEARGAAQRGDAVAVAAAIAEYGQTVDEALLAAGADGDRQAALEAVLAKHLTVLASLTGQVPEQARSAIQHAIDRSSRAQDRIGGPAGNGNPGGPNGSGNGNGPQVNRTPRPDKTPKPPAERPSRSAGPSAEESPGRNREPAGRNG